MGYGKISVAQGYKPSSRTVAARRRWRLFRFVRNHRQYPYNLRNSYFPYTSKANEARLYMNIFLMFNKK